MSDLQGYRGYHGITYYVSMVYNNPNWAGTTMSGLSFWDYCIL